jgi:hypothetical protein
MLVLQPNSGIDIFQKVTEEFRLYRAITAMKVVFMGPPASGKSFYAALMSQE